MPKQNIVFMYIHVLVGTLFCRKRSMLTEIWINECHRMRLNTSMYCLYLVRLGALNGLYPMYICLIPDDCT